MTSIAFCVVRPSGHRDDIEMQDSFRIVDLKRKFRDEILESREPSWRLHLILGTSELEDNHTLSECNIRDGCEISLIIETKSPQLQKASRSYRRLHRSCGRLRRSRSEEAFARQG